jgi:death-on-curing protein
MDVVALNEAIIGRPTGLSDEGKLAGGLARAEMAAHYEGADLAAQSAYLIAGIALAHPFVDGNKRTAYATVALFWALNGMTLRAGMFSELARTIEALVASASRDTAIALLADWLREQIVPQ